MRAYYDDGMQPAVNPYESPVLVDVDRRSDPQAVIRRLRLPVLGLIVTAGFHALAVLCFFLGLCIDTFQGALRGEEVVTPFVVYTGLLGIAAVPAILQFVFARSVLRLHALWACRAAALLACIPLLTPMYVLGIPFGIWATVVLFLPSTAAAFELPAQVTTAEDA